MRGRVVPTLYWIALVMLLIGAVVLLLPDDTDELEQLGQVIAVLAWPIAAIGALLDTIRHQRAEDAAEHRSHGS